MARISLPDKEARRLLGGGIVVLVTTAWHGQHNVAPIIWHTPLSLEPPLIGIAVHPSRHTHDMIRYSQQFAINVPTPALMKHVQYTGVVTGADTNKIEAAHLPTHKAEKVEAPLLDYCIGWIECGVNDALRLGDHTLFIAEVASVTVEEEAFDGVWSLTPADQRPVHYVGGPFYAMLERRIEVTLGRSEPEPGEEQGAYLPPEETDEERRRESREA
ncbi:MAG TPA: flavin reductase family protein [Dehalococcoidia bacterium]|nr:flavin reductase family protein [Dehalococcoidia bacterium]